MDIQSTLSQIGARTNSTGQADAAMAVVAQSVVDKLGREALPGDKLDLALSNLLASGKLAALLTASDLTALGVLTTLATNIGAHDAQGVTLLAALLGTTGAGAAISGTTDIVTAITPATGDTVTANATKNRETIYLTPAGTLAALTLVFPSAANSRIGQTLTVFSTQIVTALTVPAAGLTIAGAAVTALAANTPVTFRKVAAATWIRLQ